MGRDGLNRSAPRALLLLALQLTWSAEGFSPNQRLEVASLPWTSSNLLMIPQDQEDSGEFSLSNLPKTWTFSGMRKRQSDLKSSMHYPDDINNIDGALMPDGGLSPCVIKVIGVGGGGSNAVCIHWFPQATRNNRGLRYPRLNHFLFVFDHTVGNILGRPNVGYSCWWRGFLGSEY